MLIIFSHIHIQHNVANHFLDCPEREATYIITTGGINDPEKA